MGIKRKDVLDVVVGAGYLSSVVGLFNAAQGVEESIFKGKESVQRKEISAVFTQKVNDGKTISWAEATAFAENKKIDDEKRLGLVQLAVGAGFLATGVLIARTGKKKKPDEPSA